MKSEEDIHALTLEVEIKILSESNRRPSTLPYLVSFFILIKTFYGKLRE